MLLKGIAWNYRSMRTYFIDFALCTGTCWNKKDLPHTVGANLKALWCLKYHCFLKHLVFIWSRPWKMSLNSKDTHRVIQCSTVLGQILCIKYVMHEIVNSSSDLCVSLALPAVIYVSLPQGKQNHQSVDPPIRPSIMPRGTRATPNPRTLHPPWDETWPHAPLSPPWSLRGAAGFDSSYRASIQPEIKPWWENTGLDRQTDRWIYRQWGWIRGE